MWIFGYGSLIYRPAFPYEARHFCWIRGWKRRFWQASPDHRGTPEAPGRVVTLIADEDAITWGMGYRVSQETASDTLRDLDHREQAGYSHHHACLNHRDGSTVAAQALVYVAGPKNPSYLGPASLLEIAAHIARSRGPSGPNDAYLFDLAEALRAHGIHDPHVHGIEEALLTLRRGAPSLRSGTTPADSADPS